jgi:hypothetical protein
MRCVSISICECRVCLFDRIFSTAFVNTTSWQQVKQKILRESYMESRIVRRMRSRLIRKRALILMLRRILNRTREEKQIRLRKYSRRKTHSQRVIALRVWEVMEDQQISRKEVEVLNRLIARRQPSRPTRPTVPNYRARIRSQIKSQWKSFRSPAHRASGIKWMRNRRPHRTTNAS